MKKILFTIFLSFISSGFLYALELPEIIGNDMLLQQRTMAKLWGWAESGHYIEVVTGWDNKVYTVKKPSSRRWDIRVSTPRTHPNLWH